MKHKKKYFTRTYLYLDILEYLVIHNNQDINKAIQGFTPSDEINYLFLGALQVTIEDIDFDMYHNIINTYKQQEEFINKVREQFQHRHTIMMDKDVILLINLALAEYLTYNLDKKLVIKIYVDMAADFQESTEFIHGVLDKSLECLINMRNECR